MSKDRERLFEVMGRLDKTFKPKLNEELEDIMDTKVEDDVEVEPQEHGEEGPSYKAKLEKVIKHAEKIYESLPEGEIPSWVQDKITLAEDYLDAICGWMHGEKEEEKEETNDDVIADIGSEIEGEDNEEKEDEEGVATDDVADVEFEKKEDEDEKED